LWRNLVYSKRISHSTRRAKQAAVGDGKSEDYQHKTAYKHRQYGAIQKSGTSFNRVFNYSRFLHHEAILGL
jgi:hypothetical protein